DLADFVHQGGQPLPGVAQVAIQMARHAAAMIVSTLRGQARRPFHYRDKGVMATIGRNAAVAEVGPLRLSGLLGWLVWVVLPILFLIGFRNRRRVMIEWAWAYLTFNRGVRLIPGDTTLASRQRAQAPSSPESRARAS